MARLNEMPAPTESIETLRKKMLRQNRELAKTNNIRALRIRELENECACMLSENLELRSRILELEKQVEDNEAQRIADHAMAIKARLESQLTEWGSLIAELGLEPPAKRHSPMIRRRPKQTMGFSASRPSPSQRRLREIAKDIEELGHIAENKSYPRRSMNPEQIMALRSEADIDAESPELGPPPMSKYIEEDPVKIDSPSRLKSVKENDEPSNSSKARKLEPPVALSLSKPDGNQSNVTSPPKEVEKEKEHNEWPVVAPRRGRPPNKPKNVVENAPIEPLKAGSKRKFGARDDDEYVQPQRVTDENSISKMLGEKTLIRDKADGRSVSDFAKLRKKSMLDLSENIRKPLSAKSTNDDINSPKKNPKMKSSIADDIIAAKTNAAKPKAAPGRPPKTTKLSSVKAETVPILTAEPQRPSDDVHDSAAPIRESSLFSPSSPALATLLDGSRGDTPPPNDISSNGETSRPSRRNRMTISYAEPNLRVKMRRPTKELFDAVAGEGKYARRISNYDPALSESAKTQRQIEATDIPPESDKVPASPLATKHLTTDILSGSVVTERRKRSSSIVPKAMEVASDNSMDMENAESTNLDSSGLVENDVYEFTSGSPPDEKEEVKQPKKRGRRRTTTSRQSTMMIDEDSEREGISFRERNNSRRRSMMI
ncbi:uncharacterized protein TrAFT101_004913 [Trichoderma asperellum]|uniref:Shugoshin C-terminal domain-containing protein n=1 Tax=Trichoderma asperellum (strain ATCC 204424 / CBS 433.97 / NBRC 101777) TaxID=1042311 RepID=A0A2T3Z5H2_TRIA4|nr:hypothetical protein M441DRAFT_143195 [Trichoderma asperellum CBS 433.97]PTB40042.1 hypothetical protein M441DRAFT_143195 [Trichoderma asperellum CBS 433.97]UKZ89877.1 hypothetical protein TrAFT101_004913 [Trichoderma asperellum]